MCTLRACRDDLSGLQKKLEGELRTRANSRASIRFEMDTLRSQLAAFQEVAILRFFPS
jgi:hypothetical protein